MSSELLCQPVRGSSLLRCLCSDGSVCPGQCCGGSPHEALGGVSQTGIKIIRIQDQIFMKVQKWNVLDRLSGEAGRSVSGTMF